MKKKKKKSFKIENTFLFFFENVLRPQNNQIAKLHRQNQQNAMFYGVIKLLNQKLKFIGILMFIPIITP